MKEEGIKFNQIMKKSTFYLTLGIILVVITSSYDFPPLDFIFSGIGAGLIGWNIAGKIINKNN